MRLRDYEVSGAARLVPAVHLRRVREALGLTQEEFAGKFLLPLRTIQGWEQGRKDPSEPARVLQRETLRLWKDLRRSVVFVTHNLEEAIFLGERIIVFSSRPRAYSPTSRFRGCTRGM